MSLSLENISKKFGNNTVLSQVNLNIKLGTIHALVGENGAGKSTLMKILYGLEQPNSGNLHFQRQRLENWNPKKAIQLGFGMVHQHFMLAPNETVLDNIVLGVEKTQFRIRQRNAENEKLNALMERSGLFVPLLEPVSALTLGQQSRCEILKVLYRNAKILILDEPTAVLTPQEIADFLQTLLKLKASGHTILLVTHKLQEVVAVADQITVLRQGRVVDSYEATDENAVIEKTATLMVGRKLHLPKAATRTFVGTPQFELQTQRLSVHAGEILGIAGVEGNGQEEIVSEIVGRSHQNNSIFVIPPDRQVDGLVLPFSLIENFRLRSDCVQERKHLRSLSLFQKPQVSEKEILKLFDIRPLDLKISTGSLSGGNQQKLVVARALNHAGKGSLVLAANPTRGVDLGAIEFIHGKLLEAAEKGASIILISSELEELMSLSHRIGVLYRGKISAWFSGPKYNEKQLGLALVGATNAS